MVWTERDIGSLLYELCVELGFCLPPDEQAKLKTDPPEDAEGFADAVFLAEGLDPRTADRRLWRDVRGRIREARARALGRSVKPMAEAYARLLASGLVSTTEAIAWLDRVIEQEPKPEITVMEASLLRSDSGALITGLRAVPGSAEPAEVARLMFGFMAEALERSPDHAEAVARELYRMAGEGWSPEPEAEALMWLFEDELELTRKGLLGGETRAGIITEMESFLRKWAQRRRA